MDLDHLSLCIISLLGHEGRLPYEDLEMRTLTLLGKQGSSETPTDQQFHGKLDLLCEQYVEIVNAPSSKAPIYALSAWGMQVYCQEQRRSS